MEARERWEHLTLLATDTAPWAARQWVREQLAAWDLAALTDDCLVVTSELVTNAVRYGGPPLALDLRLRGHDLRLEVADGNPSEPHLLDLDPTSEGGRGLAIAVDLTDSVQVEQIPDDGKRVVAVWKGVERGWQW